jgi:hypothetical protein
MMEKNKQTALSGTTEQKPQDLANQSPNQNKQENSTTDIIEIVDSLH